MTRYGNYFQQTTNHPPWLLWVFLTVRISTPLYWHFFLSFFYQPISKSAFKKWVGMAIYRMGFTLHPIANNWKYNSKYLKTPLIITFTDILRYFLLGSPCVQGRCFLALFLLLLGSPCVQVNVCITNYFLFPIITPHICIGLHWCWAFLYLYFKKATFF